jgi:hypothetical protein
VAPSTAAGGVHAVDLVASYREELQAAGHVVGGSPPASTGAGRPRTSSQEAFEVFASLAAAPEVLAAVELFAALRDRDDFSVSCLPGNGRTP